MERDTTERPPLNQKLLEDLRALQREGVPDMLTRMIDAYMRSAPGTREKLHEAVAEEDPDALGKAAHSLKSSSSNLGAFRLRDLCKQLEDIGRANSTKGAAEILEEFEQEYKRVHVALIAERSRNTD